jgi:hypothetical protein
MFPAKLFSLAPGTRVAWHDQGLVGTVVTSERSRVLLRWDDGTLLDLARGTVRAAEYAGAMEVLADDAQLADVQV